MHAGNDLEIVGELPAIARQPYAVSVDTPHEETMQRLLDVLLSSTSRARFESVGFRWLGDDA